MTLRTIRIILTSILIIVIGGGLVGTIMDRFGISSKSAWEEPVLPMPLVSTRNHFRSGVLTSGHGKFDYMTTGAIPGFSPGSQIPDDLLIIVHGFNNYPDEAANACGKAQRSLLANGFDAALVGYSWDANTQLDPGAMIGFHEGRIHAVGNGGKLARFIVDYKSKCPDTRLHIMGYSLGTRVTLEALRSLNEDPAFADFPIMIETVHLVGASVDNEEVQTDQKYGVAIENEVRTFYNYYSLKDRVLGVLYLMKEGDRALGETGIEEPELAPANYISVDARNELVVLDEEGRIMESRRGDNHMSCLGILDDDGNVLDDGIMNLVAEGILGIRGG